MAKILILSTSLRENSLSRIMAKALREAASEDASKAEVELLDLRDYPLPFCDAGSAYEDENVGKLAEKIGAVGGVLVAAPVYNFDLNGALKNALELTGSSWKDKVVGFLCAAGGASSYMSVMGLANSLMLDFRCVIVPRFVYATGSDFAEGKIANAEISARIRQLLSETVRFAEGLGT